MRWSDGTAARVSADGSEEVDYSSYSRMQGLASSFKIELHHTYLSSDFIPHARRPQGLKTVRGPVLYRYGHLGDNIAPCTAGPGLRSSSGWPLAAFNTRTGDTFRRSI